MTIRPIIPLPAERGFGSGVRCSDGRIIRDRGDRGGGVANAWRISADLQGRWDSVMRTWDNFAPWANFSGAGGWSFLDFLRMDEEYGCEVVAGEPSDICFAEQQAHYTLWAIAGSPLSEYMSMYSVGRLGLRLLRTTLTADRCCEQSRASTSPRRCGAAPTAASPRGCF